MQYYWSAVKDDKLDAKMTTLDMNDLDKNRMYARFIGGVFALILLVALFQLNADVPTADDLVTTSTVGYVILNEPDSADPVRPKDLIVPQTETQVIQTITTTSIRPRPRSTSTSTLRKERTPTVPGNCNSCGGDRIPTRLSTLTATTTLHGVVVSEFPMPLPVIILLSLFCLFTVEWKRWLQ